MSDQAMKLTPEMQQTIDEPNPTVLAIEKLIRAAKGDERVIEKIVRGYTQCHLRLSAPYGGGYSS